ncbi:hypothetical protein D3C72_2285120 [compost metagenome]
MRLMPLLPRGSTANASTEVVNIVPVTAKPYAAARLSELRNHSTRISTAHSSNALTCGR